MSKKRNQSFLKFLNLKNHPAVALWRLLKNLIRPKTEIRKKNKQKIKRIDFLNTGINLLLFPVFLLSSQL